MTISSLANIFVFFCVSFKLMFTKNLFQFNSFAQISTLATTTELGSKGVKNAFKAINIGSYQEVFPSFYPISMMDRTGLDAMADNSGLCLQDLVGNNNNNNNHSTANGNGNIPTSQSNSNDHHLHNHHHHMDGASVSVSSAISNIMSPSVGCIGSGLSHLHHSTHPDLSGHHHHHHHHITSPHTPSVLHEPLEKLKCEYIRFSAFLHKYTHVYMPRWNINECLYGWIHFLEIAINHYGSMCVHLHTKMNWMSLIYKSDHICSANNHFVMLNNQFVKPPLLSHSRSRDAIIRTQNNNNNNNTLKYFLLLLWCAYGSVWKWIYEVNKMFLLCATEWKICIRGVIN